MLGLRIAFLFVVLLLAACGDDPVSVNEGAGKNTGAEAKPETKPETKSNPSIFEVCSDDTTSVKYYQEPDPGTPPTETAVHLAGYVTDTAGIRVPHAHLYLAEVDSVTHHTYAVDSAETDCDGHYSFGFVDSGKKDRTFRVLAKVYSISGTPDSMLGYMEKFNWWRKDSSLTFNIQVGAPASMRLYTNYVTRTDDLDSICFHGTFICGRLTKEDQKRGYTVITGLPMGKIGDHYAWHGDEHTDASTTIELEPGDTLYVSDYAAGYPIDSVEVSLPKAATQILESAGLEASLEKLFVPMIRFTNPGSYDPHSLIDEMGNYVMFESAENESIENRNWFTFPVMKKDPVVAHWLLWGWITDADQSRNGSIKHLLATVEPEKVLDDTLFNFHHDVFEMCAVYKSHQEDLSGVTALGNGCKVIDEYNWQENGFAVSFWAQADGSAKDGTVLSIGNDTLGIKMARCESDSKSICFNSSEGKSTDKNYGKAEFFDGKRHHVSFAIYERHVFVMVDGEVAYEADMDFDELFEGKISGIRVGAYALNDFVIFRPGTYVHKTDDKDWSRFRAWLTAFYELQK